MNPKMPNIRRLIVIIAACMIFLFLSLPQFAAAQDKQSQTSLALEDLKSRAGLSDQQMLSLRPLVEKQLQKLRSIFGKYSDKGVEAALPLWNELRASRWEFEKRLAEILTGQQLDVVLAARAEWVQNFLSKLRSEQSRLLEQRLELNTEQSNQMRSIMADDFARRLALLEKYRGQGSEASASFAQELSVIQLGTDMRLDAILTPEQREKLSALDEEGRRSPLRLWGAVPAVGEFPQSAEVQPEKEPVTSQTKKKKRGEFVIAPIPMINPTLENGLGLAVAYLYRVDKKDTVSPPSVTGLGGFRTSNGSRGWGLVQQFYLKEDRYRLTFAGGRANVNYNFFGIGTEAGSAGVSIPINLSGSGFLLEGLMRVKSSRWYVGARYYFLKSKVTVDFNNILPTGALALADRRVTIPEIDINLRTAALGPHILRDTRNDSFYPTRGSLFDVRMGFSGRAVGGRRTYQGYQLSYNKYYSLSPRQVIAARATSCFARGNAPFYDLCVLGKSSDLRGYEAGRYLDRNMLAGQAEYRLELPKRFGFVAFGGAGEVANTFSDFRSDKLLPGGGLGLRFRLTKQSHINFRVDYAIGKDSHALYIGIGEAF